MEHRPSHPGGAGKHAFRPLENGPTRQRSTVCEIRGSVASANLPCRAETALTPVTDAMASAFDKAQLTNNFGLRQRTSADDVHCLVSRDCPCAESTHQNDGRPATRFFSHRSFCFSMLVR